MHVKKLDLHTLKVKYFVIPKSSSLSTHHVGYYDLDMPMPLCSEHCSTTQMITTTATTTAKTLLILERPWQPPLCKLKLSPGVETKLVEVALGSMRGQDTNRLWVDYHTDTLTLSI